MQFEWIKRDSQGDQEDTKQTEWVKFHLTKEEKIALNTICAKFLTSRATSSYEALPYYDASMLSNYLLVSNEKDNEYTITTTKEYLQTYENYAEAFPDEFGGDYPEVALTAQGIAKAIKEELIVKDFGVLMESATPENITRQE